MSRTISTKLAVEGETAYKQAIAACNAELSTLKSGLALVESEFRGNANSIEALTAKGAALESMYSKQQEKVSTLQQALQNAQRAQEEYAARVATAQSNIERCEKALENLKNSTGDTAAEQEALTKELDKWNAELEEAQAGQTAAERGVQSWQKQLNNAKVDLNNLSNEINRNNGYLNEAGNSADGCAESIDEYGKEVKEAGEESKDFGSKSTDAINALAYALAAAGITKAAKEIANALKGCVDTFASFESQMSTVKAISGASGEEFTALAQKAKYMGATTAFTATQAAEAFEYMAMAGWKTNDMLSGLEGIMHLAAASGEDLASTSDIVTDALTAFGLSASDSSHFADVLAAASSNANTNVGMMGETFKYAAPVAGALGYSVEDTALAIGLMANAGIKGSQAGTALRGTLSNLAKPSETVAQYMEVLDVSLTDSEGNMRSLSELIEILRDRFSELSEAQQAQYAAGLAGKEAMSGLLAIVNASDEDFQKLTSAINECNGAAYNMSQIQLDNYAGKVTLLESAIDGLKMAIGEQLTPVLGRMAEIGTDAISWATDFVNENPWIVKAVAALAAGLVVLTGGITAAVAATAAWNAVLSANPIGIVVASVVAFTAAVAVLSSEIDVAGNATREFTNAVKESKQAYEDLTAAMEDEQTSTDATAAALLKLLDVEEKSTAQKESIIQMVDELNEAVPELGLAYDETTDSINMTGEALESMLEKAAAQKEYEAQVARLTELYKEQTQYEGELEKATNTRNDAMMFGLAGVQNYTDSIKDLLLAQSENAAEIAELEAATEAYEKAQQEAIATQKDAAAQTGDMTTAMEGLAAELESLEAAYMESYVAAKENIEKQIGLFQEMDGSAKTSIDNLISTLQGQVAYMETYAANIQKAMELGVDKGLIKKLSDGSEESAQILAAIVEGGEDNIAALNEEFAKVEEGKRAFSETVAEMENDFSRQMEDLVRDLDNAIQDMDVYNDTYITGQNNMQGLIDGTASKKTELINKYAEMGRAALDAYKREVEQASPSKKFREAGRFDIQGIISGAELEKENLAEAYEDAGRAALLAMEQSLPSSVEEPPVSAALNNQTAAIVAAVSGRNGDADSRIQICVDKLEVRNDSDIQRIAQELYYLTERESRSRGGGSL